MKTRWLRGASAPSLAIILAAAMIAFVRPAIADPAAPADARAAQQVIERQLEAFSRDAWAEAFAFAGPGVRSVFQTPDRFAAMVRGGYPMVWRPSGVEFLGAEEKGGDLLHELLIHDAAGQPFRLQYLMRRIDGAWRIEGVWILSAKPPATA